MILVSLLVVVFVYRCAKNYTRFELVRVVFNYTCQFLDFIDVSLGAYHQYIFDLL